MKFLILQETDLSSRKKKKIQEGTPELEKIKKKTLLWKNALYLGKWDFLAQAYKTYYISGGNLQRLKIKTFFYFFTYFLFVEKEVFKHKCKRKLLLILSLIKKQNFVH